MQNQRCESENKTNKNETNDIVNSNLNKNQNKCEFDNDIENKTIFNTAMKLFPFVENGRIRTEEFLEASKGVSLLVDMFGTVFTPITYDLNRNIDKIETKFLENKTKYTFLDDLVMDENKSGAIIVTDGLQWLRRGLHFMWYYFDLLLNSVDDNSSNLMKTAYENTLKQYHSWMGQQVFNLLVKFAPTKTALFQVLALNQENKNDVVQNHMRRFLINLKVCIDHLLQFYLTNGFECSKRV